MDKHVTLDSALITIEAARQLATKIGVMMNIAVVDAGAKLVAFARMEGAWPGSIDIAQDKAFTAPRVRHHHQGTRQDGAIQ